MTTVVVTDQEAPRWPGDLATLLAAAGTPVDVAVVGSGSGFAGVSSPVASSFADLVAASVVASTQLVVFAETSSGDTGAGDVAEGAAEAFSAVEEAAPDALVVVIGPWYPAPDGSRQGREVQAALQEAADGAEMAVIVIDPLSDGWPAEPRPQSVADLVLPRVGPLVGALAQSGARD